MPNHLNSIISLPTISTVFSILPTHLDCITMSLSKHSVWPFRVSRGLITSESNLIHARVSFSIIPRYLAVQCSAFLTEKGFLCFSELKYFCRWWEGLILSGYNSVWVKSKEAWFHGSRVIKVVSIRRPRVRMIHVFCLFVKARTWPKLGHGVSWRRSGVQIYYVMRI